MGWQDAPLAGAASGIGDASWASAPLVKPAVQPMSADPTGSFLQNFTDGTGRAINRAGLAALQASNAFADAVIPRGLSAALDRANTSLGLSTHEQAKASTDAAIAEHARLDKPLEATAGGKVGDVFGTTLTLAPAALAGTTLAPTVAANALLSGLLTPGDAKDRGFAALAGGGGAAIGKGLGDTLGNALTSRLTAKTAAGETAAAQSATRDATFAAGRDAGYVVPPATMNQGIVPSVLEGIGGKIKTSQSAAVKNQNVTNALARKAVGAADDVPLTAETLQGIRDTAGKAYEAVKQSGPVQADAAYTTAIQKLGSGTLAQEFPELANGEIATLSKALDKPGFSADSAVELLKQLRFDGYANKALQDPAKKALGKAQIDAATAVESLVDRNLQAAGKGDVLQAFQDARTLIAKTHTVEKSLNGGTGNVIAGKLAQQVAKGKPLSGELQQIGEFAQAFPKATQEINTSTPMFTPLDMVSASVGAGSGNPIMMALAASRPVARAASLNPLMQGFLANPQYGPGLLGRQVPKIADNDLMRALLKYGSAASAPNALQK